MILSFLSQFSWLNALINNSCLAVYEAQQSVQWIYDALFIIIFLMNCIFLEVIFLDKTERKKNFKKNFIYMEFLINYPVTLGVIGTLYSISVEVSSSDKKQALSEVMSSTFDMAVVTTIIGGLVYGYCFILQAIISKFFVKNNPSIKECEKCKRDNLKY